MCARRAFRKPNGERHARSSSGLRSPGGGTSPQAHVPKGQSSPAVGALILDLLGGADDSHAMGSPGASEDR
jgi:hypothetical protein